MFGRYSKRTFDYGTSGAPWIATHLHGSRACMTGNTLQHHIQPVRTLNSSHHANGRGGLLQNRSLLDVRLKHGMKCTPPRRRTAAIPNPLELSQKSPTRLVLSLVRIFQRISASNHTRAEHRWSEATPFLIRPTRNLDGPASRDMLILEGSQNLESRHDAVHAIKPTTGRLGIEMTSHENRRQRSVRAGPRGKDVADFIDGHSTTEGPCPGYELIPARLVLIGQGLPIAATPLRATDSGQRHQAGPEPLAVDSKCGRHSSPLSRKAPPCPVIQE